MTPLLSYPTGAARPAVAARGVRSVPPAAPISVESPAALLDWVHRAPLEAIAWAEGQPPAERERAVRLVAQRWAEADPTAAFTWLVHQDVEIRSLATEAVATGICGQPGLAVELGTSLQGQSCPFASAFNGALIGALTSSAEFAAAQQISAAGECADVPDWENLIFRRWSAADPAQAAAQLQTLPLGPAHDAAFSGLVEGWAERSPRDLAEYARALPAGADRVHALEIALLAWDKIDPSGLASWSSGLDPGPVKDAGLSLAVATTDRANGGFDQGLGWVSGISDSALRRETLRDLVLQYRMR